MSKWTQETEAMKDMNASSTESECMILVEGNPSSFTTPCTPLFK